MPQFFVDKKITPPCEIELIGSDAHHIGNVLRLKAGDWIQISDGLGNSFKAEIERTSSKSVKISVKSAIQKAARAEPPVLALSIFKSEKFEIALQKTVELGCRRIIPVKCERSLPHLAKSSASKNERWNKIAIAAAKQSGLPFIPCVEKMLSFEALCDTEMKDENRAMLYEGKAVMTLPEYFKSSKKNSGHLLLIGPEGGFSSEEVEMASRSGISTVSLGPQILRVETAAIAAVTIWQYELGNMKGS